MILDKKTLNYKKKWFWWIYILEKTMFCTNIVEIIILCIQSPTHLGEKRLIGRSETEAHWLKPEGRGEQKVANGASLDRSQQQ